MNSANSRRLYNLAAAVLLAQLVSVWLQRLWASWRSPFVFDDAYMFARYAANIRHGFGFAWNPGGSHTYGPTSLLWQLVILILGVLPIATWKMLTLASWLCSIGVTVAISWAVARNAESDFLRSTWRVLPIVAVPLTAATAFAGSQTTGMETMLAALLCACFVGCSLAWSRGEVRSEILALVALLLFLTRPDSGIVIVLFPSMLCLLKAGSAGWPRLAVFLGAFGCGVALDFAACLAYFHTFVPLSFYMKSGHAYQGIRGAWHPELLMLNFLAGCELCLVALVLLVRRADWKLVVCCLFPAALTFAYLLTVDQIMGYNSRFYLPYVALFLVPALLVWDRSIVTGDAPVQGRQPAGMVLVRSGFAAVIMLCFLAGSSQNVLAKVRHAEHASYVVYDPAELTTAAKVPLHVMEWDEAIDSVTNRLVAPLPQGVTVAATEVGYLGSHAPQINIIDMAGLNDTEIALHGFHVDQFLLRKPDLIWLPHDNYTYQRGLLLSDASFQTQYDVYADAAIYGIAIRKDSPYRDDMEQQMKVFWSAEYPGYTMSDYLVSAARWSGQKHRVVPE